MQLHPADTGGTFFEIDIVDPFEPDGLWPPSGGRAWADTINGDIATHIVSAEIQSPDPQQLAERWAGIVGIAPEGLSIPLENGAINFVPDEDGRGEGLGGMTVACADKAQALSNAEAAGLPVERDQILWCGLRLDLV